jgi:hypothetical protein
MRRSGSAAPRSALLVDAQVEIVAGGRGMEACGQLGIAALDVMSFGVPAGEQAERPRPGEEAGFGAVGIRTDATGKRDMRRNALRHGRAPFWS